MSDYEPRIKCEPTPFLKHDDGKLPLSLLPVESLEEVAKVLKFGAEKYARNNWKKGTRWSRIVDSFLRHVYSWMRGEDKCPETGISHLAHAACNLLFLIYFEKKGIGQDDL